MKTSKVLRLAKKELSEKYLQGVCIAVDRALDVPRIDVRRVQAMIESRIGGIGYATYWLAYEMLFAKKKTSELPAKWYAIRNQWVRDQKPEDLQAWRHRWVDSMIAEFKAKGD